MSRSDDIDEESSGKKRHGSPIEVRRVFWTLWRKKLIIIGVGAVAALAGFITGKFAIKSTFVTSATLRYVGLPGQGPMDVQRDLPSLVSVAYSEPILLAAREAQGINANIDVMRAMVNVESDPGSGLVTFRGYGGTPQRAADLANSVSDIFVEHHRARRERELSNDVSSLQQRIEAAAAELQSAREAYDAFREANGITNLSAEQENVISSAAEMRTQADLLAAEVEALEATVAQLEGELENTPQTTAVTPTMTHESSRLTELRQRLREARGQGLGEAHPQVQSLRRQVAALEGEAGDAPDEPTGSRRNSQYETIRRNLSTARTELEGTRQRQASLEALAVAAQERGNRFSEIEGQAASLLAQVNVKTALVEELTEQRAGAQDQIQDIPTGFRQVSTALPPENPVPSKRKFLVAVAIPSVIVFLLFVFLIGRDLWGLRLRFPSEVAWWGQGPVLGMSKWPLDPVGLTDVIADMEDMTDGATGNVLIVGTSERDVDVVQRVAFGLSAAWSKAHTEYADAGPSRGMSSAPKGGGSHSQAPLGLPSGGAEIVVAPAGAELDTTIQGMYLQDLAPEQVGELRQQLVASTYSDEGGTGLRRASRSADAVIVVIMSDEVKATTVAKMKTLLGRERGVAYLLLGVDDDVAKLPDRVGPNVDFWDPLTGY